MAFKRQSKKVSVTAALLALAVIGILCFVFSNMRDMLLGTPLSVATATDGTTLSDGFLPITGNARHARSVSINGRNVSIDRDGKFVDGVLLSPGYNVVEIASRDQFGKEERKTYHLVLDETHAVAIIQPPTVQQLH